MVEACETVSALSTSFAAIYIEDWTDLEMFRFNHISRDISSNYSRLSVLDCFLMWQLFGSSLTTSRSSGGALGIKDMALTRQALYDWLGITRFGGSRCVCVQVREDFEMLFMIKTFQ